MEVGPAPEPWFKVPGLSLSCCVTTGNHLHFSEPQSKQGNKIPAFLLSLPTEKVTREKEAKMLGNVILREG